MIFLLILLKITADFCIITCFSVFPFGIIKRLTLSALFFGKRGESGALWGNGLSAADRYQRN